VRNDGSVVVIARNTDMVTAQVEVSEGSGDSSLAENTTNQRRGRYVLRNSFQLNSYNLFFRGAQKNQSARVAGATKNTPNNTAAGDPGANTTNASASTGRPKQVARGTKNMPAVGGTVANTTSASANTDRPKCTIRPTSRYC
jgi:hypothetical protein